MSKIEDETEMTAEVNTEVDVNFSIEQYIEKYGFCHWQAQQVIKERDKLAEECICQGNWRKIVKECEHLIQQTFVDDNNKLYTFFGVVHGGDDYYYGMWNNETDKTTLLSCVGNFETWGFELLSDKFQINTVRSEFENNYPIPVCDPVITFNHTTGQYHDGECKSADPMDLLPSVAVDLYNQKWDVWKRCYFRNVYYVPT